jgi:hypothetical protein
MTDYIRREALITAACERCNGEYVPCDKEHCLLMEVIHSIPAADVVPVVRCKDCLHYEMGVCLKIYDDGAANKDAWQERKPDDYCSYGEDRNVPINCGADMRILSTNCKKTVTTGEDSEIGNLRAWLKNGQRRENDV